ELVFVANLEVFETVSGRGMHAACPGIVGDMLAEHYQTRSVDKRMQTFDAVEVDSLYGSQRADRTLFYTERRNEVVFERLRHDHDIPIRKLEEVIRKVRMHRHAEVRRQCPGGRRPDHEGNVCFRRDEGGQPAL